jgi:hypothetical protein
VLTSIEADLSFDPAQPVRKEQASKTEQTSHPNRPIEIRPAPEFQARAFD